jgi:hypothetical protein
MPEFRLGIIGGCMSHQPGIPMSKLYHRQLAQMLRTNDGVQLRIKIAHRFEANYQDRLIDLINHNSLDGVLLHSRVMFIRKAGLFATYTSEGATHYVIHPFLFRRQEFGKWMEFETQNFDNSFVIFSRKAPIQNTFGNAVPGIRIGGLRLRGLNQVIGMLVGLDKWAIEDEMFEITGFNQICLEKRIPFFVLGPTPHAHLNHLCRKMSGALEIRLPTMNIPFCRIENITGINGAPMQLNDGMHLTVDGHHFVAEQLYPLIAPWIKIITNGTHHLSSSIVA